MNKLLDHHILLDSDGVLFDFVGGVEKLFDVDLSELNHWDLWKEVGLSPAEFWKQIQAHPRFWAELQPYPWARDLLNHCLELTGGNVTIVTSPDLSVGTYSQKAHAVATHFPNMFRKLFIGPEKHLMAKPKHILIDDNDGNVDKFNEHGGIGVLFPQLWNSSKKRMAYSAVVGNVGYLIQLNVSNGAELN